MPEEVKEELAFLYSIGVNAEELDFLINFKIREEL